MNSTSQYRPSETRARHRVMLIGLDGATFDVLDPLVAAGHLPTFKRMIAGGAKGVLKSTTPPQTVPAWNSIFTGMNPGKHGVPDFFLWDGDSVVLSNTGYRMVDTIWRILAKAGSKQIIVNEPVTFPPEPVDGVMVSGFMVPPGSKQIVYPDSLLPQLEKACGRYLPDLDVGFEKVVAEDKARGLKLLEEFARSTFNATMFLVKRFEWDMLAVIFTSTDRLLHFYFRDKDAVRQHFQLIDGMIAEIIDLDPEATKIIVSDHGFGPLDSMFYVNTWLSGKGLAFEKSSASTRLYRALHLDSVRAADLLRRMGLYSVVTNRVPMRVKDDLPLRNAEERILDTERSVAFTRGAESGIFVKSNSKKEQVLGDLRELKIGGVLAFEKVMGREDAIWGPYVDRSADVLFVPRPGLGVSPMFVPESYATPNRFGDVRTGTHRQNGIFMAFGPKVKNLEVPRELSAWDVAPTLLYALGFATPTYMDGKPIAEIFREVKDKAELVQLPETPHTESKKVFSEQDETAMTQRLKGLGYV